MSWACRQFTLKERDNETGLDYFLARYYSSVQGRFTSPDPTLLSVNGFNPQTWNRYTYVLNNPLAFIDPDGLDPLDPPFIGTYDKLTDEQKRLFETYVKQNHAEELKNPLFTAESLWNSSVAVANGDAAAGPNSRLLDDGQLTNFIGGTKMLEKRGVINQVASISEIHGDAPEGHTYRIIGELKNNSSAVDAIKKELPWPIAGSGHGKYSESNREQGPLGAPNGQVSRVPDGTGVDVDVDVDYRCILCKGHKSKGGLGSDIRVGTHTKMAESGMDLCRRCQGPTTKSCDQNPYISKTSLFAAFGGEVDVTENTVCRFNNSCGLSHPPHIWSVDRRFRRGS